jgi:hypothetical protein
MRVSIATTGIMDSASFPVAGMTLAITIDSILLVNNAM